MWGKDASNFNFQLLMPNAEKLEKTPAGPWWVYARGLSEGFFPHNSLVYYLAQVIKAKNCPTTFYYIFQLVWVPMTTTQNIRVCFLSSNNTLFS